ncbi:Uma2 family endonuclease [Streptomyces sp. NPDC004129]
MALPHHVQLHGRLPARYRGHQGDPGGEASADHAPLLRSARTTAEGPVSAGNGALGRVRHDCESAVLQGIGLWLAAGADYAIPDLAIVDADIDEHFVKDNSYGPVAFRLVLEVTSGNWKTELRTKVSAYAAAHVPVYVIVDRKHQRIHVLTEPSEDDYSTHRVHAPGELVTLPDSLGAKDTLDVKEILDAGRRTQED